MSARNAPLPEAVARSPASPTTWSDRVAISGCFLLFTAGVVLFVLGAWTAVQFVLDRV